MTVLSFYIQHNECFVALKLEGKAVEKHLTLKPTETQAMALVPFIQSAWEDIGCPGITCLIAPRGPGAFTSLRVVLAAAQGFELAFPKSKIFSPTHFDVLACATDSKEEKPFIVLIDSKKGDFYGQIFYKDFGNKWENNNIKNLSSERYPLDKPKVYTYESLRTLLKDNQDLRIITDLENAEAAFFKDRLLKNNKNLATCQIELYEKAVTLREVQEYQQFQPFYLYLPDYVKKKQL